MRTNFKDYALYRGEELVMVGTLDEISQKQGIKKKLLQFYKTPSYREGLLMSQIELLLWRWKMMMKMLKHYDAPAPRMPRSTSFKLLTKARGSEQIMQFDDMDELERMRNTLLRYRKSHSEFNDIQIRMVSDDLVLILKKKEAFV